MIFLILGKSLVVYILQITALWNRDSWSVQLDLKGHQTGQLEADHSQPKLEKCKKGGGAKRGGLSGGGVAWIYD